MARTAEGNGPSSLTYSRVNLSGGQVPPCNINTSSLICRNCWAVQSRILPTSLGDIKAMLSLSSLPASVISAFYKELRMNTEYIAAILAITRLEFNSGVRAPKNDQSAGKFRNNAKNEQFDSVRADYPSPPEEPLKKNAASP
jgi:hypothetical protein